jgi:hypothetical protein
MELSFPIEFLVHGTAVSLQAKRAQSRAEWKERIKEASRTVIPQPHFASDARLAVTLFSLPDEPMEGDIDNIVKPSWMLCLGISISTIAKSSALWSRSSSRAYRS